MRTDRAKEELTDFTQRDWWQRWLGDNEWGKRLGIGIVFILLLALFLHFREVRMPLLVINTTAENYIISQVDFAFPDEEATRILKEQALRDIGFIYRLEEAEVRERRYDFENMLIHNQQWRHKYATVTFAEAYKGVDALEEAFLQAHFTDARTLQKMRELQFSSLTNYSISLEEGQFFNLLPKEFWGRMEKTVFIDGQFHPETASLILSYFEHQKWALEKDVDAEQELRHIAQEKVPTVYILIQAGAKLISPGERVTGRHIALVKFMKQALIEQRRLLEPLTIFGSLLLSSVFTICSVMYLSMRHKKLFQSLHKLLLLTTVLVLTLAIAKLTEYIFINQAYSFIDLIRYPLFVPLATILICILIGTDIALFASGFLSIVIGVTLAVDHDRFLVINLIASVVTIICARRLHKRTEVFIVCAKAWFSCIPVIIAFNLIENNFWNFNLMTDMIGSLLFMLATSLLVVFFLPLLESLFHE